jgi:Type I restriction enzyme R protein N terminus (HSDR_N)
MSKPLALPDHGIKCRSTDHGQQVFDPIRRKWLAFTPEEEVRQHLLNYLRHELGCPVGHTVVERLLVLNGLRKRADIVVLDRLGAPLLVAECKAPSVSLGQAAAEQAARYNTVLRAPWLLLSNGMVHYAFQINLTQGRPRAVENLPSWAGMQEEVERYF